MFTAIKSYMADDFHDDLDLDPYAFLSEQLESDQNKAGLKRRLNKLRLSGKEKSALWGIVDKGIWTGYKFFRVGHVVLDIVITIVSKFPRATCGLILGLTLQALVSSIPLLGAILGPLLGSLATCAMVAGGALLDLKGRVRSLIEDSTGPLKAAFARL